MDRAEVAAGERVLDVGCGCGQTSLQLVGRVSPDGSVLGIDISGVMLDRARQRAREQGEARVRFEHADAQTHALIPESFELVFSRFGVMFFADATAAFANLHQALVPGGRLAFVCWQGLDRNPWMRVPLAAAARHISLPEPPAPGAPGPFAFADTERVRGILEAAGFVDVGFEPQQGELWVGGRGSLDQTVDFVLQMGPAGAALRSAGETARPAVARSVREALEPYASDEGVRMPAAAWIVTGRV
jgi:SAM-dependent methyltransferase